EIREFFWKWRRHFYEQTEHSLNRSSYNLLKEGETPMSDLGAFGNLVANQEVDLYLANGALGRSAGMRMRGGGFGGAAEGMPMPAAFAPAMADGAMAKEESAPLFNMDPPADGAMIEPTVRSQFADTAYWNAALTTAEDGTAEVALTMPENLTGWKLRAWGMGHGTKVGEATTEVTTFKNLLVRLQAPRFFVETDEVVLSAIVHNYLATEKSAEVVLELEGNTLELIASSPLPPGEGPGVRAASPGTQRVTIPANGEVRVDWRVKAVHEGEAVVTMKALTDEESDAMQMKFPVYVHGMLKTESFSGIVRHDQPSGTITINVPEERRAEQTRLEVRYSPTLAGAMVDALPYLADYPYGCTEQTLNRFLPTVITQNILKRMNLDLAAIKEKRTNLNAQEIGDDQQRAADWERLTKSAHGKDWNPVFDDAEVELMVKVGVRDLAAMQLSDGGWGWFSGWGEHSYPHTTAVVVHGLQIAAANGVALLPDVLPRGVAWLVAYQNEQVRLLRIGEEIAEKKREAKPGEQYRTQANDLDALVYMVLIDSGHAGATDTEMQKFLYRDRSKLSLYSQAMFGLALHKIGANDQRDMVIRNISQFVKTDDENQTTYIDLPNHGSYWWYWYGDVIEANAYYLKLLTATNPQDPQCAGLVKYLLNNRRHATYWNSTRDTAVVIEALADYLVASGEAEPNMLVEVVIDGEVKQTVEITKEVLFTYDNSFIIEGAALTSGEHTIELRRSSLVQGLESRVQGSEVGDKTLDPGPLALSPLYYNAYLTNFTLEDPITAAGLEIKVGRKFYKLVQREDAQALSQGALGQAIDQEVLKYDRVELANLEAVTSGDLVEIELEIDSKNDYEYVIFEDMKAAGFEPVETQSGYTAGGLGAYVEFRDEKVAFFLRQLARGKHSVSYRLYAEAPGQFSALPTRAWAMYAPELKANSDEQKIQIADRPAPETAAE
ncbi:MAG: alpha-2-macroglobulin, partial [Planctomycetaceae bacterium]|nr:alpha-2-macroglobulin [Planctomycetaceae bacterium]